MTSPDPNVVEQTVSPTEPGPVDPNIETVLEGADESVTPNEDQLAFGAAGDVPGLVATPQGLADSQSVATAVQATPGQNIEVELQDTVGQQDRT